MKHSSPVLAALLFLFSCSAPQHERSERRVIAALPVGPIARDETARMEQVAEGVYVIVHDNATSGRTATPA
jgi:hypothetical protein